MFHSLAFHLSLRCQCTFLVYSLIKWLKIVTDKGFFNYSGMVILFSLLGFIVKSNLYFNRPPGKSMYSKVILLISTKTYILGTQKNRLNKTCLN